ncbi:spermatogenesis-associated serine-rich protein 1-like isoform X2 [Dicentrarchus labrax]|nr:spermatogenesis-associated serine-rich protein 1-like isoform X2 [Dicentrarchus labrax]XP_051264525.1 spermatogenesis-associated serine-rich protein 1-like isoform X2 [Dicentrarchus labrax]
MEWKEQDGSMLNLHQPQAHTVRAEESCSVQDSPPQATGVFDSRKKQSVSPRHAVIGARPFCSPEYSHNFHKLGSTLPHSTFGTMSNIKADTSIPLQSSTNTCVPYPEKKRLLDRQEEIQEVKQLDEWKPAVCIFTAVLEGLDDKAS